MSKVMTEAEQEKKQFEVKSIIDDAVTSLILQGLKRDSALSLLAFQALIRMDSEAQLRDLLRAIEDRLAATDDDEDA